jgi:hypothetical protein
MAYRVLEDELRGKGLITVLALVGFRHPESMISPVCVPRHVGLR